MGKTIKTKVYSSPAGDLVLGSIDGRLCLCDWTGSKCRDASERRVRKAFDAVCEAGDSEIIRLAALQLDEYFAGKRTEFDVPLAFSGDGFRDKVWRELLRIPYGSTISYAELARRTGNPKAVRAVASANGANPISVFVPCHRVIGSDGRLVGYGGGLEAKRILLDLEASKNRLL